VGAWLGTPASGLIWLVGGSVVGGTLGLVLWIVRLKRGARLARRTPSEPAEER
ncbi:MAG: hypothetical protein IH616_10240, partial [Gemmatimonadales bacterium]|nr:hypothetical protein [Gemmatimonadales bacterium]